MTKTRINLSLHSSIAFSSFLDLTFEVEMFNTPVNARSSAHPNGKGEHEDILSQQELQARIEELEAQVKLQELNVRTQPIHNADVATIKTIKLPPFWRQDPDLWFIQAKNAFQLHTSNQQ